MLREAGIARVRRASVTQRSPRSRRLLAGPADAVCARLDGRPEAAVIGGMNRFENLEKVAFRGAAARATVVGHREPILSFRLLALEEMQAHRPKVARCTPEHRIAGRLACEPE